jgi:diacylglycerol kinase (ATP)
MRYIELILGGIEARIIKIFGVLNLHPNVTQITPNIWVGGKNNPKILITEGFDTVLDLQEYNDFKYKEKLIKNGIEYLSLKIRDKKSLPVENMDSIVDWVAKKTVEKKKILIHCNLGRGRSVFIIVAYLIKQGISLEQALNSVKNKRRVAYVNEEQMTALINFLHFTSTN